jgi:hypothetical protein
MTLPRSERLRITQEVYRQWQEIYGDREDAEAEAANYSMISEAMKKAEENWDAQQA